MMWSIYSDRESRRIFSDAAVDVAMSISKYGLVAAGLTGANYFGALQFFSSAVQRSGQSNARTRRQPIRARARDICRCNISVQNASYHGLLRHSVEEGE